MPERKKLYTIPNHQVSTGEWESVIYYIVFLARLIRLSQYCLSNAKVIKVIKIRDYQNGPVKRTRTYPRRGSMGYLDYDRWGRADWRIDIRSLPQFYLHHIAYYAMHTDLCNLVLFRAAKGYWQEEEKKDCISMISGSSRGLGFAESWAWEIEGFRGRGLNKL